MDGNWFGSFVLMWFLIGFGIAVALCVLIYLAIKVTVIAYILLGCCVGIDSFGDISSPIFRIKGDSKCYVLL